MKWEIDKNRPICPQIVEHICIAISNGVFNAKDKIFSVRELAIKLGVNPNTVQKSYDNLEKQGVIFSIRGSGWYVCEDTSIAIEVVRKLVKTKVDQFVNELAKFGFDKTSIIQCLKEGDDV